MKSSDRLISHLQQEEGFTPVAKHLAGDRPEVITGGFGDTDVKLGQTFTWQEATERLRARVTRDFEPIVNKAVIVSITQEMFDSLVSFVYNVGPGNPHYKPPIDGFLTSTLLRKLNSGDYSGAAAEFARWNKSAGRVQPGLVARRKTESEWFLEKPLQTEA